MKKFLSIMMIIGSISIFAGDNVVIDKEVTGINKETLETREVKEKKIDLEQKEVDAEELKASSTKIKDNKESLNSENTNEDIKKELSSNVSKESSLWKYIVGALVVVGAAFAL